MGKVNIVPQHVAFKVAKKFDDNGGIISPEASVRYGPTTRESMLNFRNSTILLTNEHLYNAYREKLEPAHRVHTAMKAIVFKMPLADIPEGELKAIIDGKTYFITQDEKIKELIQVKNELLTPENLTKPSQLIKMEDGWETERKIMNGEHITITHVREENDQMSIALPKVGLNYLKDIPDFLFSEKELREGKLVQEFMKEHGDLEIYIAYQFQKVAGGLVTAGNADVYYRWLAHVPQRLNDRPGVLVHDWL